MISWDVHDYDIGVDRGVVYLPNRSPEPWNGLISVTQSINGLNREPKFVDGNKVNRLRSSNGFSGIVEAFDLPDILIESLQFSARFPSFHMTYRLGKDIHLVYNVNLKLSERMYAYEEVDAISWEFTSRPMDVPESLPSSHLVIDTSQCYPAVLAIIEDILYGDDTQTGYMPTPTEIFEIFDENAVLRVIDNGDGSFTVEGPDSAIQMLDATTFEITWPSAVFVDTDTYTIRSL